MLDVLIIAQIIHDACDRVVSYKNKKPALAIMQPTKVLLV
jgi:hypothetical protein